MMKTHIEHQDRGERKAHGLRFGRLWALAGFVVLFCLIQGLIGIAQVATSVEITFSPSSPVVGQDVTVTWTLTVQTTSAVTFDPGSPNLSRLITAPGGGNILNDSVSTTGELSPFSSGYSFTANQAGTYTIEGDYAGCPTCDPVLNASSKSTTLAVNKAATSTGVEADVNPSATGQTVTFTATVSDDPAAIGVPTGTVTFYADGTPIAVDRPLSGDPATATCTASFNAEDSTIEITATYNGDTNYNSSSGTLAPDLTVNKAATTTYVDSDKATAVTGETVTLGAEVTGSGTTTPTGTLEFFANSSSLGSVSVNASGVAILATSFNVTDSPVSISATYSGDANYEDSSGTMTGTITVDQATTLVLITSDLLTNTVVGEPYTVGGTVKPTYANGTHTTDGTVQVSDDGTPVCTCEDTTLTWNIDHWDWSCSLTSTTAGNRTITATFDPTETTTPPDPGADVNYKTNKATDSHEVDQAATTTTVSSSVNPSVTGQGVTFTATVVSVAPGSGTPPDGTTVTFVVKDKNGSDSPYLAALSGGGGQASTTPITDLEASLSPYTVTATFDPSDTDPDYGTSTSAAFTQNVNKATTITTITGTDLGIDTDVGESYTVTGTVEVDGPGGAIPPSGGGDPTTTGNVEVSDGTDTVTVLGTALTWGANKWNWSLITFTSTTAGAKILTATYKGDDNYQASSDTDSHTVNKAGTTVAITGTNLDTADTVVGQSYEVKGTVTPVNADGTHDTTGAVQVSDGTDTVTIPGTDLSWGTNDWTWTTDSLSPPGFISTTTPVCTCTDTTLTWDTDHWDWSCDLISTTAGTGDPKTKTLTATYSGDSNYDAPATPPTTTHVVNQASTTVEITGAALDTATVVGETYTVSGRVTPANTTGTHDNTGTVEVSDGAGGATCTDTTLTWSVDHWEWSCDLVSTTAGNKTITATFDPTETTTPPGTDPNYATSLDNTASHTVNQADTTTTVTIKAGSNNPSVTGEAVTFTATVAVVSPGSGTPVDGTTVDFEILDKDSNSVDTGSPTLLSGTAEYPVLAGTLVASKSPYTVTATFDPSDTDPNYNTSTSSKYTQNVYKANTTTAIDSIAPATTDVGETYTTVSGTVAVVSPGSGTPSAAPTTGGTVEVSDGTDIVTGIALGWNSTSSYWDWSTNSFCSTTAGSKTITATYVGDTKYQPSSGTDSHTVDKADTTTTVTSSVNPCETGQSVTFTATVDVETPGSGTPVGTATFVLRDKDDITIVNSGPVSLSSGVATFTTTLLLSEHSPVSVKVQYSGDADFAPSSGTLTGGQIVRPSAFAITSDDPDPSVVNATITVTWAYDIGSVFPEDGNLVVSMTDGTDTVSCTSSVEGGDSAGSCLLDTTGIDSGVRILTATYTGTPTASDTENHTVTPRDTAVSVSGPSGSACVCQPVLLTATVTDQTAPPDGPGFTETVTWSSDGNGTFDPVVCNISQGGQCSTYYTPSASDVGNVNITASYSGDDAYGSSTSPDFVLYVGKRSTKTTVFGSDTPLVVEDTATFLVTVSDTSNCVPIVPTGEVSITVSPSGAGVLTGGSHTLTAADGGQFTFMYKPTARRPRHTRSPPPTQEARPTTGVPEASIKRSSGVRPTSR